MKCRPHCKDNDGFALVWALGCILVLAAVLTPFAIFARVQLQIASNVEQSFRYDLLADGLATLALTRSHQNASADTPQLSKQNWCRLDQYLLNVRLQDHGGLIDLNRADEGLLAAGFRSLGFDDAEATDIAARVVAFRQPLHSVDGGRLTEEGELKHAPFEAVVELKELPALSAVASDHLLDRFTIYSEQGRMSLALAPPELAMAIDASRDDIGADAGTALATGILSVRLELWSQDFRLLGYSERTVTTRTDRFRLLSRRGRPSLDREAPVLNISGLPSCAPIMGELSLD